MSCDRQAQISAYVDGELDLTAALELERHLEGCAACRQALAAQQALRQAFASHDLRYHLTAAQERKLAAALGPRRQSVLWQPHRLRAIAALVLVALAGWLVGRRWPSSPTGDALGVVRSDVSARLDLPTDPIAAQIEASHVRSVLAGRPEDVLSSDRHTVKPWFAGRLDYSPPVIDLAAQTFPLLGGRLEYIGGRPVAVLVYQAGQHLASVYVWPADGAAGPLSHGVAATAETANTAEIAAEGGAQRGFELRRWVQSGMVWWVVSDASAERIDRLVGSLRQELGR